MRNYFKKAIFSVLVFFFGGYGSLEAQMVANGSFDNGSTSWNIDCDCNEGGNCIEINPETVYGGTTPGNPVAEIDGHNNPGTTTDDRILCQEIDCFIPGLFYSLNFLAARRSSGGTPDPVSIQVEIDDGILLSTKIDRSGPFNWMAESLVFQATQTSHLISFRPNFAGSLGMLIDDISIVKEFTLSIDSVSSFCEDDLSLQLTASPLGGAWIGPGVSTTGNFDPLLAGPGIHQITYALDTQVGCPSQMEIIMIEVIENITAQITPIDPLCEDANAVQLIGKPTGGFWQGVGADGIFDPADFGVGIHQVSYEITGDCTVSDQIQIEVIANTLAQITPVDPLCEDAIPIQLTVNPIGGVWQGVGADGLFDPADFGVGIHQVSYEITGDCTVPD